MNNFDKKRLEEIIIPNLQARYDKKSFWFNGEWKKGKDFLEIIDNCEKVLKAAGFSKGQRLVVMLKNSPLIPALSLAVWKLGGIFCPLNEKAGSISLKGTLDLIKPFAVITEHEIPELENLWPCITCNINDRTLKDFTGKTQPPEPEEYAVIFSTSGTSGNPKAVPLTHNNLISNCKATKETVYPLNEHDTFLTVLPNFHSFGYTCATMLPLSIGAKIAIVPSFLPPQQTVKAIIEAPTTIMYIVPAMLSFLLMSVEKGKLKPEFLASQRVICTGGDRLSPNIHKQALKLLERDVMEGYGLTETSPVLCMNHDCETQHTGTSGPIITGYEYKLKSRDGEELPRSEREGVLWVKGPSITPGYLHAPEITAERFDSEGFFNTGDYVRFDDDGYVSILDRVTDIIIVGGFNVYPQEVEKVLCEHPAVHAAVVVGVHHDINGEIPKAYVQLEEGVETTDREIIKFAKTKMAHFKVPRSVEFVTEFPVSATGKILRRVLRERAKNN